MRRNTRYFTAAVITAAALSLTACASGGSSDAASGATGDVAMTFWHNSTTGDGKAFWEQAAADFMAANPGVSITVQPVQNEDLDGKLQTAMNSGDAPSAFLARGGGKLKDMVEAGQVMDITDLITDETKSVISEAAFSALTIDDKVYGIPTSVLPGGIYYSKDLFAQAGITSTPTTMEELSAAVDKLKAAGIQPIALGAKDAWPAAHWFYFFALRECPQDVFVTASAEGDFSDPCWLKAGEDLQGFAGTEPFNSGFLTTSAQQGAGSSAGLIANHQAAMELMGAWNVGVIADLTPDKQPLADLGWFPFPEVKGGKGDPKAIMGGLDAFACSADAPKECADFLNFVVQTKYQELYADAFETLPANTEAQSVVKQDALKDILNAYNDAAYVSVWLDTLLGQNVGNALNVGVVDMLAGKGNAQGIIDAANAAAAKE
ncbi:ABC transporter substrate-binding protein [Schaalia canis]|uniref:Extracellular solute-binding protein n=1 Tax=Schaalia canis TaxID=100469 RepID=A0A3P1SC71_9ACTO|nr:extracellular solute-binding protein [Schaalia canis]RRC94490.1 extracellular solute-binding protein [Schaalia canis]